jgi:hypothetical protein
VIALHSLENPFLKEAVIFVRAALHLQTRDPDIEDSAATASVRCTVCFGSDIMR